MLVFIDPPLRARHDPVDLAGVLFDGRFGRREDSVLNERLEALWLDEIGEPVVAGAAVAGDFAPVDVDV